MLIEDRHIRTSGGEVVGRLAKRTVLAIPGKVRARVSGILVRTREQTPPGYLDAVRTDWWETVLVEAVVPGSAAGRG